MAESHTPDPAPIALDAFPAPALPALFGAAIGPIGAKRYLPLFAEFESLEPGKPRWNWAACLCTFNWLIWRRLWLPAGLYAAALLLPLLLVGVGRLFLHGSTAVEAGLLLILAVLAFVLPALLADRLLYQHCRNAITRALERAPTLAAACSALAQGAPSQRWLQRQIMINVLLLGALAALAYLMWPTAPSAAVADAAPIPIQSLSKPMAAARAIVIANATSSAQAVATSLAAASAPVVQALAMAASGPASETVSAPAQMAASESVTTAFAAQTVIAPVAPPLARKTTSKASNAVVVAPAAKARASAKTAKGFLINVGLFADPDNARHAYVKLVKAGLPTQREVLFFKGQKVTRVRAGPFGSRAKANAAVQQIKTMQLDAVLVKA